VQIGGRVWWVALFASVSLNQGKSITAGGPVWNFRPTRLFSPETIDSLRL
jgi:hypothetical protein